MFPSKYKAPVFALGSTQRAIPSLPYRRILDAGGKSGMFVGGKDKQVLERHAWSSNCQGYCALHSTT